MNGATYTPQTALTLAYTDRNGSKQDWTGEAPLAWDCPTYTVAQSGQTTTETISVFLKDYGAVATTVSV